MPVSGSNPLTQLQGKIPGALIVNASGRPGAAPSIVLRGPVSLNATGRTQQPLYLLDGVPLSGGLPDINPNDIEDVEVVKGAAAASLYGARAGAGVINITTKSGKNAPEGVRFGLRTEGGHERHRARVPAGDSQCSRDRSNRSAFLHHRSSRWLTVRTPDRLGPGSSAHQQLGRRFLAASSEISSRLRYRSGAKLRRAHRILSDHAVAAHARPGRPGRQSLEVRKHQSRI